MMQHQKPQVPPGGTGYETRASHRKVPTVRNTLTEAAG